MNPDHLTSLLAARTADDPTRSPACPDEHQIAGYVDAALDEASREQFELHVADCSRCLALVGTPLPGARRGSDPARARPCRGANARPGDEAAATPVATRAAMGGRGRDGSRSAPAVASRPQSGARHRGTGTSRTTCHTDARVDRRGAAGAFTWRRNCGGRASSCRSTGRRSPDPRIYDVRILTDAGDVVIRQRVTGTTWRPPTQLNLQPGAEYFVHIDAYPSGDKAVSSDHVPFRLSD